MTLYPPPEEFEAHILEHYGVKGMHWGVRKQREAGEKKQRTPEEQAAHDLKVARAKKVAIGTGVLVAAAGAAVLTYKLGKSGKLPISSLKKAQPKPEEAKKVVEKVFHEQTDIIHATRGKDYGFRFIKKGGLPDPLQAYESAFSERPDAGLFNRLDDGRIALSFMDPQGRRDHAGRVIPHEVIIPKSMSGDIKDHADAVAKVWPELEKTYRYMKDE